MGALNVGGSMPKASLEGRVVRICVWGDAARSRVVFAPLAAEGHDRAEQANPIDKPTEHAVTPR